jgi:hypothetical protein
VSITNEHQTTDAPAPTTRTIELYEPAMCCSTGVCGPSADQQLITVRDDVRWAETQGATITRHNLTSDPDAFVSNTKITGLMHALGDDALPALVIDDEIVVHGRYPTRDELTGGIAGSAPVSPDIAQSSDSCGPSCGC